jgi:peptidoglycan/LPS O-acetylase OafA/YrhL
MAVGALGAWLILFHKKAKKFVVNMSKNLIYTLYIFFLIIYIFKTTLFEINIILNVLERLVVSVVFLLIILEQNFSKNSFFKFSRFSNISDLGKITYGLYCLHFIGILSALKITSFLNLNNELWHVILLETALALIISIILSKIIYKYFESPFLQIKNRFK